MYSVTPAAKTAILPDSISFTDGAVLPLALETAVTGLNLKTPGTGMMGIPTPALGLPFPKVNPEPSGKTLVVYGGSSSVGSMATQIAVASGTTVVAITSERNFELSKACGASKVVDYRSPRLVDEVVQAVDKNSDFVGIFDAIAVAESYAHDLQILSRLGGGHLAATHPPPTENVPDNVKAGMVFGVNDVANAVWKDFVTVALEQKSLKCLPKPTVVGTGLEFVQKALELSKAGVSATKLVVSLQ